MLILSGTLLFVFICSINTITLAQPDFLSYFCENAANYTLNSPYLRNLNTTLSALPATNNGFGFFNRSTGQAIDDTVNSVALCRGDVNPDVCQTCLNESVVKLRQLCPNQKEGVGYYDYCMLKYSNQNILGTTRVKSYFGMYNVQDARDFKQFIYALEPLLYELRVQAAAGGRLRKFAVGSATGPVFITIYGLVQCTPDLSQQQCSDCLKDAIDRSSNFFNGKVGGRIVVPVCNFRYETYRFFNQTAPVIQPPPPPGNMSNNIRRIIIIIVIVMSLMTITGLIIALSFTIMKMKKMKAALLSSPQNIQTETSIDISTIETLKYDFNTIKAGTNDFSEENKLGQGGFGTVYKGMLGDGLQIAVKRLTWNSKQGDLEFKNEVLLVAKLQHRNLVRLLGFSIEGCERLLVYEFMPNASLDQIIFDPTKRTRLNWEKRYTIIKGIAKGLLYLHEDSRLRIIHRDMKASNVLLDSQMNPKISDFCMARLFKAEEPQGSTSRIVGTYGYMAPEYVMHGQFSVKSDVFSYGVLVLEIITGQKNQNEGSIEALLSLAWKSWQNGTSSEIIDPTLKTGTGSLTGIIRCIHIGLLCVQENFKDRPTMASVILMLNSFSITLPLPSEPAFFIYSNVDPKMPLLQEYNSSTRSNTFGKPTIPKYK